MSQGGGRAGLAARHERPDFEQNRQEADLPCTSYAEFWPFYLREHARPLTRGFHYVGTLASTAALVAAVATGSWWWLLAVPVLGYAPAWISHFFVERNRPATFQAPVWSLISDYRMCALFLTGRLADELEQHQIRVPRA